MTFSSLISGTVPHHNKLSSRNGQPIVRVLPHHHAATSFAGYNRLLDPNQQASANYLIMNDGKILGQVPEEFRAWTSGSFEADAPSITFEIQNSGGQLYGDDNNPASWAISPAAYSSVVRLIADISKRYRWGGVSAGNVRGHREFYSTACPGGYVWARLGAIRTAAHSLAIGGSAASVPSPSTPSIKGKTIWQLADETLKGLYGDGATRQQALGANYAAVQAEINRRFGAGPKAAKKTVAQLADEVIAGKHGTGAARQKALGSNFAAVQAEINRRYAVKGPSIAVLADKVMRGEYGAGDARKARLGAYYSAVQAEVNRRLA